MRYKLSLFLAMVKTIKHNKKNSFRPNKKKGNNVEKGELVSPHIPAALTEGGLQRRQRASKMVTLMGAMGVPGAVLRLCFLLLLSRIVIPAVCFSNFLKWAILYTLLLVQPEP